MALAYSGIKSIAGAADLSSVTITMERRRVSNCPEDPEDVAEQYLLRSLPAAESERFEEHYMACESCAGALSAAEDYISSIRVAGLRLAKSGLQLV